MLDGNTLIQIQYKLEELQHVCVCSVTSVASDSLQPYRLLSFQTTLSMGSWSGLPFPHPKDLPVPESKPTSPAAPVFQGDSLLLSHWGSPQRGYKCLKFYLKDIFKVLFTWEPNLSLPAAAAAKSLQSCPTLCDPIDGSPPHSPVPGILQARTLEWVAISFSNAWKWKVKVKSLSRVRLLATPWTAAFQAPPSMGPARQEYWSGVLLAYRLYYFDWLNFNG